MKNLAILTATRAEYGLLKNVIFALNKCDNIDIQVIVTGMHLKKEYGLTYHEIEEDGVKIDCKIDILDDDNSPSGISAAMGRAMIEFGKYFNNNKFDGLLVLGDRYETLAVCCAAMNAHIPIIHLYGGETTEGAIDEAIRHSITKMSYLHLTSTEAYKNRVIQLGEQPDRVFNVGSLGVENALKEKKLTRTELEKSLNIKLRDKYAVVTFHPVTLEKNSSIGQIRELLDAISLRDDIDFIVTKSNADSGGKEINLLLDEFATTKKNVYVFASLGMIRYLSAVSNAIFVLGNSSSGIIEAPALGTPTINIGDRQRGRIAGKSIINCDAVCSEIISAMNKAESEEFLKSIENLACPYGNGNTTNKIVDILQREFVNKKVDLKKKFYDVEVME